MRPISLAVVVIVSLMTACSGGTAGSGGDGTPAVADTHTPDEPTPDEPTPDEPGEASGPSPWSNSVPDDDVDEEACGSTVHPEGPACTVNSDCGVCHDGSSCGRAANREEIERLGAQCRIEDAAECEPFAVRCCSGHCRITPS